MVKKEITTGNLQSIATTVLSWATVLVALTLAYGKLTAKDDLLDAELARIKVDIARQETATALTVEKLSTIQGDIRVIKQILESQPRQPSRQ